MVRLFVMLMLLVVVVKHPLVEVVEQVMVVEQVVQLRYVSRAVQMNGHWHGLSNGVGYEVGSDNLVVVAVLFVV